MNEAWASPTFVVFVLLKTEQGKGCLASRNGLGVEKTRAAE